MARKPERPGYQAAEGSADQAYRLPAYGSPVAEPSPGHDSGSSSALLLPGVDDRLATPETREEYIDGVRYEVMAGEPEHADPQCQLAYVVRACVAEGYIASTELLTRSDLTSDFATDVCVRRAGKNPKTGQRYLEEVSFEVANTQTLRNLEHRARKLVARGVRRVFAVMVAEQELREWSPRGWRVCAPRTEIRDRVFKEPLRIRAILDAAEADRMVVEALWAKREPNLVRLVDQGRAKGHAEGLTEAILRALGRHGIAVSDQERRALLACHDVQLLTRWLDKALGVDTARDVLTELKK